MIYLKTEICKNSFRFFFQKTEKTENFLRPVIYRDMRNYNIVIVPGDNDIYRNLSYHYSLV